MSHAPNIPDLNPEDYIVIKNVVASLPEKNHNAKELNQSMLDMQHSMSRGKTSLMTRNTDKCVNVSVHVGLLV